MAVDLTQTKIDPDAPDIHRLLRDIQGNILKSHGRDYTVHLFLRFEGDPGSVKGWIAQLQVTSALTQLEQAKNRKSQPNELFVNFFLSAKGYKFLGLRLPEEREAFQRGMKARQSLLNDPDYDTWDGGYKDEDGIHAMVLMANDDEAELLRAAEKLVTKQGVIQAEQKLVAGQGVIMHDGRLIATVLCREQGRARKRDGKSIEHFGYVDGISQPLFFATDIAAAVPQSAGNPYWDPSAPLNLVLTSEPRDNRKIDSYGSYVVFRKLEQDVRGFQDAIKALVGELSVGVEMAEALVMGRFKDGTPLPLADHPNPSNDPNNFNYDYDMEASRCPFHAHIRKTNPRGGAVLAQVETSLEKELEHRIVRRSISYGKRDGEALPKEPVGLLFMCFQSNIAHQFEHIQIRWANDPNFPKYKTGREPIIGQGYPQAQTWPVEWDDPTKEPHEWAMQNYVTLKGGEYFFAPSISFLTSI